MKSIYILQQNITSLSIIVRVFSHELMFILQYEANFSNIFFYLNSF